MEKPEDLVWYIILSSVFTASIIILFSAIFLRQLKIRVKQRQEFDRLLKEKELELINAVVKAQEDERAEIARNLHDDVGSILSLTQQKISSTSNQLMDMQANSNTISDLLEVAEMIDQSVTKLRAITNGMLPHYLLKFGLWRSLERMFDQAERSIGKPCIITSEISGALKIEQRVEIQAYYIVTELMNNIVKHAKPNFIDGKLEIQLDFLVLTLKHDGVAINQDDYNYLLDRNIGIGISSLAHRLSIIDGELSFNRFERGGSVIIKIPYKYESKQSNRGQP
jgi:signal transduction histidine kinase